MIAASWLYTVNVIFDGQSLYMYTCCCRYCWFVTNVDLGAIASFKHVIDVEIVFLNFIDERNIYMKKRVFAILAVVTLLLPIIGAFVIATSASRASAATVEGQVMESYQVLTNNYYTSRVNQYTYSLNGVVQQSSSPPPVADWVTPSNYYDYGWGRNSWNQVYTYSNFGEINQTSDPWSIPSTAAWATISAFNVESTQTHPIRNTVFHYTMNGTDILSAANALDIPPEAHWAALASLNDGWTQSQNHIYASYTLNRTAPTVQLFSMSSNSGHSTYSSTGDEITVTLQTDIPIESPVLKIADVELIASGSGTNWSATLELTEAMDEGALAVSAVIYSEEGAPGAVLTETTDGSSVIYDYTGPTLSHTLSPNGVTNEDVVVTITANDSISGVEVIKWASGVQSKAYFGAEGTTITNSFTATSNGDYTVYARDLAGNDSLHFVTVTGIDRVAPSVSLSASTTAITNTDIAINASVVDNVAVSKQLWAEGLQVAAYFQAGEGTSFTNQFLASRNGVYTVYVEDTAGNYILSTVTVSNLFKQAPELTLTPSRITPTNETVLVDVEVETEGMAQGNTLVALRWAEGDQLTAFFASGGGLDIVDELQFEAAENGRYSIYARDKAGNETVATITISNIDHTAPTLTLTSNTTSLTNEPVIITVVAADNESGLREVRWSESAPEPNLPWSSSEVVNGVFQVATNGIYTVIAVDNTGNETMQQINITNILTTAPTVLLSPNTTQPTGNNVSVTVVATALGDSNATNVVRWAEGKLPISFFHGGQSADITATLSFDVTTNGAYTVYVRDLAGNEAVEIIEINNIRSTNASLASLVVQNIAQELTLTPAFTPEQLQYTLQVGSDVSSILLKAGADEASASVTVNGNPLAAGDSISVLLSPGSNTIAIVVTAPLTSVQQTYTIEVTRERPVSSGNIDSNVFVAKLNGKEVTGLNETITSGQNGQLLYELRLDDATSMAMAVIAQSNGENELRIESSNQASLSVDTVTFRLSPKALTQLKEKNIKITIDIGVVVYEIPANAQVIGDGELVVKLQALRQSSEAKQLLSNMAAMSDSKKWQLQSVGLPIAFSINATGSDDQGLLVIPLPIGLDETVLRKLAVYLEGDGDTNSITPATIRYNSKGQAIGLALNVDTSGRAIILQADPVTITYESYINGYADGNFSPERAVTRAELAILLMNLSMQESNALTISNEYKIFADVPQSHWAAEAITLAADNGWMSGLPDNLFHPSAPLTRAELASVLVRWRELQISAQVSFPDVNSHWASAAIAAAEHEGWINGYEDGSFRPNRSVTRAEVVTILNRVLNRPPHIGDGQVLSDVPASHWAAGAIGSASQSFEAYHYLSGEVELMMK